MVNVNLNLSNVSFDDWTSVFVKCVLEPYGLNRRDELSIDSIRILRQSWDELALIMNARLMRGPSRQEDKQI